MNTSIQHPELNGIVQPSGDSSRREGTLSAWRKLPGRFTFAALLAGLLLLLFSAPAARAQGIPPGCTGAGIGITLYTSASDVHIGDTICYSILVNNGTGIGPIVCDASNIVASIVTPDGTNHPITLVRTYLSNAQSDYYPNVVCYTVRSQDTIPDGLGGIMVRATASDTAMIFQNDKPTPGGANQGVNTEVSQPCIGITAQCVSSAGQYGPITFTGTVTNCGNVTLVGVTVTNSVNGGQYQVAFFATILSHQAASFSGSYIPLNPCLPSTAIFTAQGSDQFTTLPRTVTASATTICQNTLTQGIKVTKVCPAQVYPGQPLYFSGSVSNTGNVTLTNIVVVNSQPVPNTQVFAWPALAPGEVVTFYNSYTAPLNSCSVTDTLTATAASLCGVPVSNSTPPVTCPITTTPAILVTATCPTAPVVPGGSLTYSGTVQNTGNITLTNVVVVSDRPVANTLVIGPLTLAPGASANFNPTYTVPANACTVTTTFSGTGKDICGGTPFPSSASPICQVTTAPAIAVTLACPVQPAVPGGLIIYTGTVRNSGNVTLNNVYVLNNQPAPNTPVIGPLTLAPGASAPFTATNTAPRDGCSVSNTVTASGNDNCTQALVSNSASAGPCPLNTTPGIKVTKSCLQPVPPGQTLYFSGSVSNTGNVTLTNIVVVNSQPAPNTQVFAWPSLAPGEVQYFNNGYMVPTNFGPVPICSVTDTLTATATSRCGQFVTDTTSANCPILTTPAIVVTVSCPPNPVVPGGSLTYSGTVRNTGNITLTNIIVVNNWPPGYSNLVIFRWPSLAPGATVNFTGTYVVPGTCCVPLIEVKASGQGCDGFTVTDTASGHCTVSTSPSIVVTKVCTATNRSCNVCPDTNGLRPGDLLTYSGTVSNAGNTYLYNVTVVDNQPVPGSLLLSISALAPRESQTYTGSYIVPPDFCGRDTVTALGFNLCGDAPVVSSVTAACPIAPHSPSIGVTKECPPEPTPHGGELIFSGTVSNLGNVTLVNVFVVNTVYVDYNQTTTNTPVIGPITLAPGQFLPFTGHYTVPLVCCDIMDTLTASGQDRCSGSNVTDTASAICPLLYTPGIALVQNNCPPNPGYPATVSGFVTNTGDALLENVIVTYSSQAGRNLLSGAIDGQNPVLLGPIDLAPGESSEQYFVPINTYGVTVTATGQETCSGSDVTATVRCPVATTPGITITEDCPPGQVTNGSSVDFGGLVCNSGNITLTNIFVFSSQSNNTLVLGPITLLPGACQSFAGSYIATSGSDPTTTSTIVMDSSSGVITTNYTPAYTPKMQMWFGTINSVAQTFTNRFVIGTNFNGLTYAPEDHGYGATEFYSMRKGTTSMSSFDTIIASTHNITDRFNASGRNFDALAYAAPDVGYGPVIFYYLSHDYAGVSRFGTVTPGGVVGVTTDHFVVGTNFDALTFAATDVGYGANLFYYVRHDATGLSTFGTINPALPGTITDRFTVGTNVDALVFTPLTAPGYGANNFYYLRHDASGVSTFGTIFVTGLNTATVTDRFTVGTNATELTFTDTDVAFGPNLFYFLRGRGAGVTTNSVMTYTTNTVTYTTNIVVSFTPTNTVTAIGWDIGQAQTVAFAANCLGPVTPAPLVPVIGTPTIIGDGYFSLSFPTENGKWYFVQYKDALTDPAWTDLPGMPVPGTGVPLMIYDPTAAQPSRFYRIIGMP